jgi:hypothetical protein
LTFLGVEGGVLLGVVKISLVSPPGGFVILRFMVAREDPGLDSHAIGLHTLCWINQSGGFLKDGDRESFELVGTDFQIRFVRGLQRASKKFTEECV